MYEHNSLIYLNNILTMHQWFSFNHLITVVGKNTFTEYIRNVNEKRQSILIYDILMYIEAIAKSFWPSRLGST